MRKLLLACSALAFLTPACAHAFAPGERGMPMLEKIDTDKDGAISAAEAEAAAKAHFEAMDENKDGVLSPEEFAKAPPPPMKGEPDGKGPGGPGPGPGPDGKGPGPEAGPPEGEGKDGPGFRPRGERFGMMKEKRFEAMDTDKNGSVSEAEFLAGAKKRHEMMDTNKDGKISKEEMEARRTKMRDRWQDRKGRSEAAPVQSPATGTPDDKTGSDAKAE